MKKKTLLIATMLSFALCGYAQKGEKGIGGNLSISVLEDAGLFFKLEYMKNMTDRYRIIPYVSMDEDPVSFLGIDNHLFLNDLPSVYRPYINIGAGIPLMSDTDGWCTPYLTFGSGIDYQKSEKWTWQAEIGMNIHTAPFVDAYLSVGFVYTFPERENRKSNKFIPISIPYNIGTNVGIGVGAGAGSVSTGTSTTIQTEKQVCNVCRGTGKDPAPSTVAQYGQITYQYCDICKTTGTPHYHKVCPACQGRP